MTTSTTPSINIYFNLTNTITIPSSTPDTTAYIPKDTFLLFVFRWFLRYTCILVFFLCPWFNYKLIEFFQTRSFYKDSSSKWYIIYKAVFDTLYIIVSVPIIFFLTFKIDLIHKNYVTCKFFTYMHFLSDDVVSIMLVLLCIDRMIRITCNYHLRTRFSLIISTIALIIFAILHIHHIVRLKHQRGICRKVYLGVGDYDFDIYYSLLSTIITWTIIFAISIHLTVSVYCDRKRRLKLKTFQQQQEQQQKISKIFLNGGRDSDRLELIHDTGRMN